MVFGYEMQKTFETIDGYVFLSFSFMYIIR